LSVTSIKIKMFDEFNLTSSHSENEEILSGTRRLKQALYHLPISIKHHWIELGMIHLYYLL
jgi:hypothetical protein